MTVRDLRTGAFVHRFQSRGDPNTYDVTDLELRATGSLAWVARIIQGMPASRLSWSSASMTRPASPTTS